MIGDDINVNNWVNKADKKKTTTTRSKYSAKLS